MKRKRKVEEWGLNGQKEEKKSISMESEKKRHKCLSSVLSFDCHQIPTTKPNQFQETTPNNSSHLPHTKLQTTTN